MNIEMLAAETFPECVEECDNCNAKGYYITSHYGEDYDHEQCEECYGRGFNFTRKLIDEN